MCFWCLEVWNRENSSDSHCEGKKTTQATEGREEAEFAGVWGRPGDPYFTQAPSFIHNVDSITLAILPGELGEPTAPGSISPRLCAGNWAPGSFSSRLSSPSHGGVFLLSGSFPASVVVVGS